ncbi:Protein phosphatase 2C 2 [Allomyces arbusculus]|nr:Protein phosphatase 2C 2 [Allomyces arbusculus]
MGQTLSEPITEKHTTQGASKRFLFAASGMQGWRISMEDAHTTETTIGDPNAQIGFFAVFDGHGGPAVARFSGTELHKRIIEREHFKKGAYHDALKDGFLALDDELRHHPEFEHDPSGCTAVAALITPENIYVGNAGDSRAVLATGGQTIAMSFDHKPGNPEEQYRIMAAGGFVEFGRVNGNLALSRAIGDFEFKQNPDLPPEKQIVTANPDIQERALGNDDEFLIMACDGIWDCVSNEECVSYVRRQIALGKRLPAICEELMEACLAHDAELGGVGCDNMTVILVAFLNGRSEDEWYAWMADKYALDGPVTIEFAGRPVVLSHPIAAADALANSTADAHDDEENDHNEVNEVAHKSG